MDSVIITLVLWLVGAIATAYIAEKKGRDPVLWFGLGFLCWIVALPWAMFMRPEVRIEP